MTSTRTGLARAIAGYLPGLIAVALTLGVSVIDHLPVERPSLWQTVALAAVPAVLVAAVIVRSEYEPSGASVLGLAVVSWLVFSVVRFPLLDPAAGNVDGSVYVLADLGLIWVGSYAVAAAVVYGYDWPSIEPPTEVEVDRREGDPADD